MLLGPTTAGTARKPPSLYRTIIAPNEKKLVWYKFAPKQLPDVSPLRSTGDNQLPRGAVPSPQTIIAMPPKAKPGRQIILQQAPQLQLEKDVKTPNLIAFSPAPAPPPAERPKPKAFIPPPDRPRPAPQPAPLLNEAPRVETSHGFLTEVPKGLGNVTAGLASIKRPVKKFVPPASAAGGSNRNGKSINLEAGSAPAIPGGSSVETFTAAIVGLDPSASLDRIPQGSRPAQLTAGPNTGAPASGSGGTGSGGPGGASGIRIPDLSISGGSGNQPPAAVLIEPASKSPKPAAEYHQTVLQLPRSTLSVPLRPSSRTIPVALEARFRGRNVYTLVIPIPKMPQYTGDWIVWFAEREPSSGDIPPIRAPIPARKIELVASGASLPDPLEGRVQLGAIIRKDGHLEVVSVIKTFDPRINLNAMEDLLKWEFSPASRNDVPIDVEVVIEIPFRLAASR